MNLREIVARVENGEVTSGVAMAEVRSWTGAIRDDPDAVTAIFDEVRSLRRTLDAESVAARLADVGRVIATAASIIDLPNVETTTNLYCASLLVDREAWALALEFASRAAKISHAESDLLEQNLRARSIMGRCELELDRAENAVATLEAVLAEPQFAARMPELEVGAWTILGRALMNLSRYEEAITAMQTAVDHEPGTEAALWNLGEIGLAARAATQLDRAILAFSDARELALQLQNAERAAHYLSEIGLTWSFAGEFERAAKILSAAAAEAEAIGRLDDAARWRARFAAGEMPEDLDSLRPADLIARATCALRYGSLPREKGIELALAAVRRAVREKHVRSEAEARNVLGALYAHGGDIMRGLASVQVAINIAERLRDDQMASRMLANAGFFAYNGRLYDQSASLLARAIDAGRKVLESDSSAEMRQVVRGGLVKAYQVLAELYGAAAKKPSAGKLLEIGQHARAINLMNWLAASDTILAGGVPELMLPFLAWRRSEANVEAAAISNSPRLPALLRMRTDSHRAFVASARKAGVEPASRAPVITLDDIPSILRPGECVIDIFGTLNGIVLSAFGDGGAATTRFVPWAMNSRQAFLMRWDRAVSKRDARRRGHRSGPSASPLPREPVDVLAAELRERLFSDLAGLAREVSSAKHIFIVPDSHLSHFPLWSITETLPDASVSIIPGLNTLGVLQARERSTDGIRVALGDVTNTLDFAPLEIDMLSGFTRMAASKPAVIEAIGRASFVHFAGHGTFNARNPYLSGVVVERRLSPTALLTVLDLLAYAQTPAAYLITLSACSTGLPRLHPANEFVGMPSACLIAGTRNVIASLWPVDDGATYLLMRELYGAIASGMVPSSALAAARRRLKSMSREEAAMGLGGEDFVPRQEQPYAASEFSDAFHHYGVD